MSGARQLTRRLWLERPVRVPDGAGGFRESWDRLGAVWAEIRPRSGTADAVISETRLRITVRAAPVGAPSRPTAQQRFVEGARIYRITAVTEADPEGRFLTCFATEETGA